MIRDADLTDLCALVALEQSCFSADRISRRGLRHLLTRANARVLVSQSGEALAGAVVVLFRRGSGVARLYSIAVAPACRGRGVAAALVRAVEDCARERGCRAMRLEIRVDNAASQRLFAGLGYRLRGQRPRYYEDGTDALCYERPLPGVTGPAAAP